MPQSGTAFAVVALGIFAYFYMKGQLVYLKPSDTMHIYIYYYRPVRTYTADPATAVGFA